MNVPINDSDMANQATQTFRIPSSAAGTNAQVVKTGPGRVFFYDGTNTSLNSCCFKMYDQTSVPDPATDSPFWTKYIEGDFGRDFGAHGIPFTNGLAIAFTIGQDDADTQGVQPGNIRGFNIAFS